MLDLHYSKATELAKKIRKKEIGCLEILDLYLGRIEKYNDNLNAIILLDREAARMRAREADRALANGTLWGPFHGVPMSIKESFDVAGKPSTWGVPAFKNNIARDDSLAVKRMKAAGVTLFGKTNVPFMLSDWQSFNEIYGTTNNPWDTARSPGGSSGGSAAALAAGLTGIDAGSDIGASIRNPAHYCGIFGHKPTFGILPTVGHALPGSDKPTDISVIGPLARGADDLRIATLTMAGITGRDAAGLSLNLQETKKKEISDFKVGVLLESSCCVQDNELTDQLQVAIDSLGRLGVNIDDKVKPVADLERANILYLMLLRAATGGRLVNEDELEKHRARAIKSDPDDFSYRTIIDRAVTMSHREWLTWNNERELLQREWQKFFDDYDLLLTPVAASAAFPHDHAGERADRMIPINNGQEPSVDQLFWAGLPGVVYLPATSAPVGFTRSGLPCGLQIIGPHMQDLTTIHFSKLIETHLGGFVAPEGYN
ncbi:MAG: amidase [Proteobacteria bacterium]|nr:amidase [Pseudomonadota bacterium]